MNPIQALDDIKGMIDKTSDSILLGSQKNHLIDGLTVINLGKNEEIKVFLAWRGANLHARVRGIGYYDYAEKVGYSAFAGSPILSTAFIRKSGDSPGYARGVLHGGNWEFVEKADLWHSDNEKIPRYPSSITLASSTVHRVFVPVGRLAGWFQFAPKEDVDGKGREPYVYAQGLLGSIPRTAWKDGEYFRSRDAILEHIETFFSETASESGLSKMVIDLP
jgi:hypothetical protein